MTVSDQTNRISAVGTGAEQTVSFTFPIVSNDDITVTKRVTVTGVETALVETTDYTMVNNGESGGSITTVSPFVASSAEIHIVRATPKTQILDLVQGGSFNAENIENALDKNTKLIIENKDGLDRTLKFPTTDPATSIDDLPNSIDRAGKVLTFNSSTGKPEASVDIPTTTAAMTTLGKDIIEASTPLEVKELTNLDHVVDVKDYGAVGDGVTDDFAAITAAIAAASAGDIVFFPRGTYILSQTLAVAKKITLKGTGFEENSGSVLEWTQTDSTNGLEPSVSLRLEGLYFKGNNSAGNGIHIDISSPIGGFVMRDVSVMIWGGHCLYATQFYINEFYNCSFRNSDTGSGIYLIGANENRFFGCKAVANDGIADVYLEDGNLNFFDVDLGNGTASYGLYFTGESYGNTVRAYHDGGTDRGMFFDVDTYNNVIFYQAGTARNFLDSGVNNRIINSRMSDIPSYQHAEHSLPLVKNRVRNSSGVYDNAAGWNSNGGVVLTRVATDGVSTGTCVQAAYDAVDNGLTFWAGVESSAIVTGDLIVVQFWAKTSRALTDTETAQWDLLAVDGGSFDVYPANGSWFMPGTEWKFFSYWARAEDDLLTGGAYPRWRLKGSTGEALGSACNLLITDVALYVNPGGIPAHVPPIFSGGITQYVNWPLSHTGRLDQMLRLPNLGVAPANPEPGAIVMADGMNFDPLGTGTSCSELVFYGQCIMVGDDYKWTASGSGTDEYYLELTAGGDPSLLEPDEIRIEGSTAAVGTMGSLAAGEWDFGDNDTLGYSTIYVRLSDGTDPDTKDDGFVTGMKWTAFGNEALK